MDHTESKEIRAQLNEFGVKMEENSFLLPLEENNQSVELHFFEIDHLKLKKYQAPLIKKLIFWLVRIITFDKWTGNSLFQDKFEYRWKYLLTFKTTSGKVYEVLISDFDLFKVSSMVKEMNEKWFSRNNSYRE